MKAYLQFVDDPYYQKRAKFQSPADPISPTTEPDSYVNTCEESNLLPDDIPQEYREILPEHVIFHAHRFMEITRLVRGQAIYIVDKTLCHVHPGEIIVFNSFVPHAWVFLEKDVELVDYSFSNVLLSEPLNSNIPVHESSPSTHNLYLNIWHTKPAGGRIPIITSANDFVIKEDFLVTLINSSFHYAHIKLNNPMHTVFTSLLNDIELEGRNKQFAYEYILHAKLIELMALLFRLHSNNNLSSGQKKPELLMTALKYISENIHQNLRLEMVAKHCYLTPQYFSAYFKKHTGMNFSKYLSELRLEHVLNELIQTDKSILDIAYQCGFNSKTSFYRAWYSKYQITPAQIRSTYK